MHGTIRLFCSCVCERVYERVYNRDLDSTDSVGKHGWMAQSAARVPVKNKVSGSIPLPTVSFDLIFDKTSNLFSSPSM